MQIKNDIAKYPWSFTDHELGYAFCTEMLCTAPQQWMAVPVVIHLV